MQNNFLNVALKLYYSIYTYLLIFEVIEIDDIILRLYRYFEIALHRWFMKLMPGFIILVGTIISKNLCDIPRAKINIIHHNI